MIRRYFAYKNDKLGVFNDPFFLPYPLEDVKEVVSVAVRSGQGPVHGEELSLYLLGSMDDKTGIFVPGIEFICSLSEFMDLKTVNQVREEFGRLRRSEESYGKDGK